MSAPPLNEEERDRLFFAALFFPALPAVLFLLTFIELKGPPELLAILPRESPWLLWSTRVVLVVILAGVCQRVSRPMLREFCKSLAEAPSAAPADPLERETVADLWVPMIGFSLFGGVFA